MVCEVKTISMVKAVIFDWGGVLIDNPLQELQLYCANALNVSVEKFAEVFDPVWLDFQKGVITESMLWEYVCKKLHVKKPQTNSLWKDAVEYVFTDKKDMYDFAHTLRNDGYKTGFLSNTEVPAMEYFYDRHYDKFFDAAVFSCREHMVKPDPRIYQLIALQLHVAMHGVIFIDDNISYVQGAKDVAMQGILFENTSQTISDVKKLINLQKE